MEEFNGTDDPKYVETFGVQTRDMGPYNGGKYHVGNNHSVYTPEPKPWEGVDRTKFPKTWFTLVTFYFGNWYQMTRTRYPTYGSYSTYKTPHYPGSI